MGFEARPFKSCRTLCVCVNDKPQWEAINLFLYGGIGGTPLNEYRGVSLLVFMSQLEIPYAMYLLGKAHENGLWGVSKDKDEAIRLYRESANLGCTAAMLFQP